MSKKEYKKKLEERAQKYQSVAYEIGSEDPGDDRTGDPGHGSGPYAERRCAGALMTGYFLPGSALMRQL